MNQLPRINECDADRFIIPMLKKMDFNEFKKVMSEGYYEKSTYDFVFYKRQFNRVGFMPYKYYWELKEIS
jgi:hypothetical protein